MKEQNDYTRSTLDAMPGMAWALAEGRKQAKRRGGSA
jgi:hypothetical protein